jgi:chorismate mutase/prephenate dehydratase
LKIESRPFKDTKDFKFWFFIDIEGNLLHESIKEVILKRGDEIKFLGSYLQTL